MKNFFFILFCLTIFATTLFAEDPSLPLSAFSEGRPYWKEFVNMLITLGVILAIVLLSLNFLKKLLNSRMRHLNKTTHIKIIEKRMLAQKSSLYLVDISGKTFLISESPSGVQLISEVDMKNEELCEEEDYPQTSSRNFTQMLQKKIDFFRRKEVSRSRGDLSQ